MPFLAIPRADDAAPLPTLSGLPQKIPYDTRHIPEMGIVALKIYAFGGLAFMIGTCLAAVSYWFWIVVIKQEYADSPPWLDLHPEVRTFPPYFKDSRLTSPYSACAHVKSRESRA